jgi:hypothetical protein
VWRDSFLGGNRSGKTKDAIPNIRKWPMEQGVSQVDMAKTRRVNEMTIMNWEIKADGPKIRGVRDRLIRAVPGAEGFL